MRAAFGTLRIGQLIGAPAAFALHAFDHRVAEAGHVSAGFPNFWVHDDAGVQTDDVGAAADGVVPPGVFDIPFEFGAGGAVIPEAVDATVDLAGLKDETAALAERDDLFH